MDLSVLTGWEHESFGIGDVVTVDDKDWESESARELSVWIIT